MKKLMLLALVAMLSLTACTSRTSYGDCIGAFEEEAPGLKYKVDTMNVVWGIVFMETIIVPVVVVLDETKCPVGRK